MSLVDQTTLARYRSLKMAHIHPNASCNYLQAVLKKCAISGLVVSCIEVILEHGCFYVVVFLSFFNRDELNLVPDLNLVHMLLLENVC